MIIADSHLFRYDSEVIPRFNMTLNEQSMKFDVEEVCEKAEDMVEIQVSEACFNKDTDKFLSLLKFGKYESFFYDIYHFKC